MIDDSALQLAKLNRRLRSARIAAAISIVATGTLAAVSFFHDHEPTIGARRIIVTNGLGETAELTGDGLVFKSATGKPLVWLSAGLRPRLEMWPREVGAACATLGIETTSLNSPPHGYPRLYDPAVGDGVTVETKARDLRLRPEQP